MQSISFAYMGRTKESKPTAADAVAAAKLRAIWERVSAERRLTQSDAAAQLKMTQPAVSRYLLGRDRLGFRRLMQWADFLGVPATEIRDDLPEQVHVIQSSAPGSSRAQQQNHVTALQLAMTSLITATRRHTPVAATAFAEHLKQTAKALRFSDQSGLLARLIGIAQQDPQTEEGVAPLRKRRSRV